MIFRAQSRLRHLGIAAMFALVLGQTALVGHAAAVDHQPHEICQVCVVADRCDDTAAGELLVAIAPVAPAGPGPSRSALAADIDGEPTRARGPPTL